MFNERTVMLLTALTVLSFACQDSNAPAGPICEFGDRRACVGRTLGECDPGYRVCQELYSNGKAVTFWSGCQYAVDPRPEVCDGKDNDCDNRIDNGVTNRCGTCGVEPAEICDGLDNNCNGEVDEGFADFEELCDGEDNDCDGAIDEGLSKRRACDPQCGWVRECDPRLSPYSLLYDDSAGLVSHFVSPRSRLE